MAILLACIAVTPAAKSPPNAARTSSTNASENRGEPLQNGDVLFIRGGTLLSRLVAARSGIQDGYTHVGLIEVAEDGAWFIHAYPGEAAGSGGVHFRDLPGVQRVRLSEYLSEDSVIDAVVYRIDERFHSAAPAAIAAARDYHNAKLPFDMRVDLDNAERLYCSEMIWRAYLAGGVDLIDGRFDEMQDSRGSKPVIYPMSLASSSYLKQVGPLKMMSQSPKKH